MNKEVFFITAILVYLIHIAYMIDRVAILEQAIDLQTEALRRVVDLQQSTILNGVGTSRHIIKKAD